MAAKNRHNLTVKQQLFCDLYRSSGDDDLRGNAKRCYQIAYNTTAESAEANGSRLLKNKYVAAYLEDKAERAECEADISEARILKELAGLAFLDPGDFYNEKNELLPINKIPEHARRALTGLESASIAGVVTTKVHYKEKRGSLELLMKYKKMLTDKV